MEQVGFPSFLPPFHSCASLLLDFTCSERMDGLTENRFLDLPPSIRPSPAQSLLMSARSTVARKPHKTGAVDPSHLVKHVASHRGLHGPPFRHTLFDMSMLFDELFPSGGRSNRRHAAFVCLAYSAARLEVINVVLSH